jgi:hypothetical protein
LKTTDFAMVDYGPPLADTPWHMNNADTQRAAAEQRAHSLVETIREIGVAGSLRHIAAALNELGVPTPKGDNGIQHQSGGGCGGPLH